jgi:hypothetical protein
MAITSVRFTANTGGDDNDHDTGVFVRVQHTRDRYDLISSSEEDLKAGALCHSYSQD